MQRESFPGNHGFTVCRSVEQTSTGDELASVSTCKSAISLRTLIRFAGLLIRRQPPVRAHSHIGCRQYRGGQNHCRSRRQHPSKTQNCALLGCHALLHLLPELSTRSKNVFQQLESHASSARAPGHSAAHEGQLRTCASKLRISRSGTSPSR